MSELKSCPFGCEKHDIRVGFVRATDEVRWWQVDCGECGAHAGPKGAEDEAIAAWNTRPQPSAEPVAVRQVAQAIDDLEWLSTDGRFNPHLTAIIASALEAARREALERIHELETALAPFASHIGKVDAPVVFAIGSDTWTGTLTGQDFANAAHAYNKRNPEYLKRLALKENPNAG